MTDQTPGRPSVDDLLQEVLSVVNELARKSAGGDYLYRGEPESYPEVSSGLYRKYRIIAVEEFDIRIVQTEMLQEAKKFIGETGENDNEVLDQLQHFGYSTNLIDFTTDYHIALFFACDGKPKKDGRVILLNKTDYPLRNPTGPANRVIAQKSVFVQPPDGFVEPSDVVVIPHQLKERILKYLDNAHGVAARTIYNDLHGFIRYHGTHESAYAAFYEALMHKQKGDREAAIKAYTKSIELNPHGVTAYYNLGGIYLSLGENDLAIQDYCSTIDLDPRFLPAYSNRAAAYGRKGDHDLAIQDHNKVIELNPHFAISYANRAATYIWKGNLDHAIQDCNKAIELDPHLAISYDNRGVAYSRKGQNHLAIKDFNRAIGLDPRYARAYYNRGESRLYLEDWDQARSDLYKAQSLGVDIVSEFCGQFGSVPAFERKHNVKLPASIAQLLTRPE